MNRCQWCNTKNPKYIEYHDHEWGVYNLNNDRYLFEMLLLESFQAGLSWECVLDKRENFKQAFSNFDPLMISLYDEKDIERLKKNEGIIRNSLKIKAAITNAKSFLSIQKEFSSFKSYLLTFSKGKITYEIGQKTNQLSDELSLDLRKRGMKFVGSTIIYSYLQAIGIINSHEKDCYLYKKEN